MKKTIIAVALLITMVACKKEKEEVIEQTDYLTAKEWILVSKDKGGISEFTDSAKYNFQPNEVLTINGRVEEYSRTANSVTFTDGNENRKNTTYSIDKLNEKELILSEEFTLNFIAK